MDSAGQYASYQQSNHSYVEKGEGMSDRAFNLFYETRKRLVAIQLLMISNCNFDIIASILDIAFICSAF